MVIFSCTSLPMSCDSMMKSFWLASRRYLVLGAVEGDGPGGSRRPPGEPLLAGDAQGSVLNVVAFVGVEAESISLSCFGVSTGPERGCSFFGSCLRGQGGLVAFPMVALLLLWVPGSKCGCCNC